jgi:putative peptidoglycan lipid II flippase
MPFIKLVLLRVLRAATSIASLIITAKFIGVSTERDAWVLALSVIGVLSVFLFNPTLEIFRAKVIHVRGELSKEEASVAVSSYISFSILIALLAIFFLTVAPKPFAVAIGAGASTELLSDTGRFLRWGAIYVLLTQMTNAWSSVLNSENRYIEPEVIGIGAAVLNVVILLTLVKRLGADALLWATIGSATVQVILLAYALKRTCGTIFMTRKLNFTYAWRFVAPALPLYFAFGAGQIALIVEKNLLTLAGPGAVSIYDYARKFVDVPYGVIIATAASLVGPALAKFTLVQDDDQFVSAALRHLKAFLLILLPVTVVFNLGGSTLIGIFFSNSASVTDADKRMISDLLGVLAWGVLGVAIYAVASQALIARGRISHYAKLGLLTQALYIAVNCIFFSRFGAFATAVGWGISYGAIGLLMYGAARIPFGLTLKVIAQAAFFHILLIVLYDISAYFLPENFRIATLCLLFGLSCGISLLLIYRDARTSNHNCANENNKYLAR